MADGDALRAAFDEQSSPTVGIEEEVMLLDPATLDLAPRSVELLDRFRGDPRFALELPASHLEIVVGPAATVGKAGVATRPVSILRSVSGETPASSAVASIERSPRARRSRAPSRRPRSTSAGVSGRSAGMGGRPGRARSSAATSGASAVCGASGWAW